MGINIIPLYSKAKQYVEADTVIRNNCFKISSVMTLHRREAVINYILDNAIVHPRCSKCNSTTCGDVCWDKCEEELINWVNKTVTFK